MSLFHQKGSMTSDDNNTTTQAKVSVEAEQGYNGWTNYETWLVNLWLSCDRGLYEYIQELKEQYSDKYELGDAIKEFIEESDPCADGEASLYSDMLKGALSVVNWSEVAEVCLEE